MKAAETNATVTDERTQIVSLPIDLPPGEHRVVVVIEENPIVQREDLPLDLTAYPVGLVDEKLTFRREDLYGGR
jgi:hypothetical protein